MQEVVKQFIEGNAEVQCSLYASIVSEHGLHRAFHAEFKKQLKEINVKKFYYLLTFTLRKDPDNEREIEKYILGQVLRPALRIKTAHYVKEYTKAGRPHWHVAVESTKYIARNRFNYYENKFGNIDISKNHGNTLEEMMNYINKEQPSIKIK